MTITEERPAASFRSADYEIYHARADEAKAREIGQTDSPYHIEVRFLGGLTDSQKQVFRDAADRWARVIVGDLPAVAVDGEVIDDVVIDAQGIPIDGVGGILGQAGPRLVRPPGAGRHAFLTIKGQMEFDTDDLASMEERGTLLDVITHEMGHVIGCTDVIWQRKGGLITGRNTPQWAFVGPTVMAEYGRLLDPVTGEPVGGGGPTPVPIEDQHGPGTRGSHWRETVFGNELMSGFISSPPNPLSRVTGGLFADLGYDVDLDGCDPFELPSHLQLAAMGLLASVGATRSHEEFGVVLPTVPLVVAEETLTG
ncbi:leishmanolysin-related zinc metalloendopeptidase [Geodermatophilus sp. SYSU D01180]